MHQCSCILEEQRKECKSSKVSYVHLARLNNLNVYNDTCLARYKVEGKDLVIDIDHTDASVNGRD